MTTREELNAALAVAELNLFEWCTGGRSSNNEMLGTEAYLEHRTQTLAHIAAADADHVRAARERVLGLQLLIATRPAKAATGPRAIVHRVTQEAPWPPSPDATYNLSRWNCTCGWRGASFRDVKGNPDIELAERSARFHKEHAND